MTSNIWCAEPASVDQALACLERHADIRESGQQRGLDRLCKDRRVTAVRKVDYRAVLGNDSVYKAELTGDPTKFGKNPAGDKHHLDAPAAGTSDCFKYGRIRPIVARNRAVVIQRQNAEFHVPSDLNRIATGRCEDVRCRTLPAEAANARTSQGPGFTGRRRSGAFLMIQIEISPFHGEGGASIVGRLH